MTTADSKTQASAAAPTVAPAAALGPATDLGDEQLAAWRAFLRAHSAMLRRIARDLDEAELPPLAWYDVMAALRDAPDQRLRQVELAERVLLSNSGLSRLVDRIEAAGLVERVTCPADRRSFNVQLTPDGAGMLSRMWPVYARGIAEDFLPALGENPCEIRRTLEAIGTQCDAQRAAEAAG
jgi:DNA-binding MarR family transcriptional regulator